MEKLKTIKEIESGIKDERFLALFRAFVKALEFKDYNLCKKLTILRYLIEKFEKVRFKYGTIVMYKLVLKEIKQKEYLYWEGKLLEQNKI